MVYDFWLRHIFYRIIMGLDLITRYWRVVLGLFESWPLLGIGELQICWLVHPIEYWRAVLWLSWLKGCRLLFSAPTGHWSVTLGLSWLDRCGVFFIMFFFSWYFFGKDMIYFDCIILLIFLKKKCNLWNWPCRASYLFFYRAFTDPVFQKLFFSQVICMGSYWWQLIGLG